MAAIDEQAGTTLRTQSLRHDGHHDGHYRNSTVDRPSRKITRMRQENKFRDLLSFSAPGEKNLRQETKFRDLLSFSAPEKISTSPMGEASIFTLARYSRPHLNSFL
jgi:hypothetical protein